MAGADAGIGQDSAAPPAPTPTPLSAICTDRPTKSNAPCTVDAGHFQYEADIYNGAFLRLNGVTTDTSLYLNPTLKYGLAKSIDIEVSMAADEVVRTKDGAGATQTLSGVGDLYIRLKDNFYTSADGKLMATVIPYIKAPTARAGIGNQAVEGGVIMPVSYKISANLTVLTVPEVDAFKDQTGDGRHVNTAQLVNLAYSLPKNVTLYAELWGDWNFDPAQTTKQYSADVAVSWGVTNYFQLDGGLYFGLNKTTPGVQAYIGVSQKF